MKNNFKLLIVLFFLLLAISYYVLSNKNTDDNNVQQFLIPEMNNKINNIDEIILSKNDESITLSKQSGIWKLQEADNFIADANKVASLLMSLRNFDLKEKKTKNPDNYNALALSDNGNEAATKVTLKSGGNIFADISLGKQAQNSQGTYVRNNDNPQSWLSTGTVDISLETKQWILTNIIDIDKSQIRSVAFNPVDGMPFSIDKITPNDEKFELKGMPLDRQAKTDNDLDSLANGLQKLTIESALPKAGNDEMLNFSVTYQLFSGMEYMLALHSKEEAYYMNITINNATSNEQYNLELQNWAYEIPKYKYDALNKKLVDYIEIKDAPVENNESDSEIKPVSQ